ncbi:DUF4148 domain-containing protein [Piscinibacterium candidicorallinum]|uniref:DUF4148 domain-containing protein n=1 Tax=Piscinibacterium candidicorallinum TaxID=1793872 RepID=A0ABV7H3N3_9BURK
MSIRSILIAAGLAFVSFNSFAGGDANPHGFVFESGPSQVSREQVRAELLAAQRSGQFVITESGPSVFSVAGPSTRSTAQVRAEVIEAARLGIGVGSESNPTLTTLAQERQIEMAARDSLLAMRGR